MNNKNNRRKTPQVSNEALYKLNKSDINKFIETERRHDALDRISKIKEQNAIWRNTLIVCGSLNFIFIILAIIGMNS